MTTPDGPPLTLRVMETRDIPDGMRLKTLAGWNQTENDWHIFLKESPDGCFVAEREGKIVGTAATIRYGKGAEQVAWISMILVDPNVRRGGIGKALMNKALEHLSDCPSVKLDATPAGRELYLKLGFVDERKLTRWVCEHPPKLKASVASITALGAVELRELLKTDRETTGLDRSGILESLHKAAPELAYGLKSDPHAYLLGRPGTNATQIGPIISKSPDSAAQLLGRILVFGQPVFLDTFDNQTEFIGFLRTFGFKEQRPLIRMWKGSPGPKGIPAHEFAIVGPEFG